MSQKQMIIEYMKEYGGITQSEATTYLGCTRLPARISEIEQDGRAIHRETITGKNRFGKTTHFTRYSLEVQ